MVVFVLVELPVFMKKNHLNAWIASVELVVWSAHLNIPSVDSVVSEMVAALD